MTTRQPTQAAVEFGEILTSLRAREGDPSYGVIARTILVRSGGRITVTDQQLANLHQGKIDPGRVSVEVLIGLRRFYGVHADELGSVAGERLAGILDLAGSDQQFARNTCFGDVPPFGLGRSTQPLAA